jgi:hypothetical protein
MITNNPLSDRLPIPERLRFFPEQNGYIVPWFVAQMDGKYDFRVIDATKFVPALNKKLCWICGQKLGAYLAFPIGPMCAINRTVSEPPSHRECAEYAVKACPFLAQRQDDRRISDIPEGVRQAAGVAIQRQPNAAAIWITKSFETQRDASGFLFHLVLRLGLRLAILKPCERLLHLLQLTAIAQTRLAQSRQPGRHRSCKSVGLRLY